MFYYITGSPTGTRLRVCSSLGRVAQRGEQTRMMSVLVATGLRQGSLLYQWQSIWVALESRRGNRDLGDYAPVDCYLDGTDPAGTQSKTSGMKAYGKLPISPS